MPDTTKTNILALADWMEGCVRETEEKLAEVDEAQRANASRASVQLLAIRVDSKGYGASTSDHQTIVVAFGIISESAISHDLDVFRRWPGLARAEAEKMEDEVLA